MDLRDTLFNNPMQIFEGLAIWIPLAIWVVYLIGWMITAEIDVIPGIMGIAIACIVGFVASKPPLPLMTPILLVGSIATLVLFPFVRAALVTREMHAIDIEAIDRAYTQLEEMPVNAAIRFKIAKLSYQKGVHGHAIAVAESALAQLPERLFLEEHKMVRGWKRSSHAPEAFRPLPCVECGAMNPPGEVYCQRCGARFLLDLARGSWVGRATARRLILSWMALMLGLVGIPAASVLPPTVAIVTIAGVLVVVVFMLVAAFKEQPKRARA